jgi:hypothetical protein
MYPPVLVPILLSMRGIPSELHGDSKIGISTKSRPNCGLLYGAALTAASGVMAEQRYIAVLTIFFFNFRHIPWYRKFM